MALVSMNVQDDEGAVAAPSGYDPSPCVYLSAAQCAALGITTPPRAGTTLMLRARAVVESVTERADNDADDPDVMLQLCLTDVELGAESTGSKANLYD